MDINSGVPIPAVLNFKRAGGSPRGNLSGAKEEANRDRRDSSVMAQASVYYYMYHAYVSQESDIQYIEQRLFRFEC